MAENTISGYIIGLLLFTFVIIGGVTMLGSMRDSDVSFGGDKYTEYNTTFNKLDDINSIINDYETNINRTDEGETGITDWLDSLIKRSSQSLKLVGSSFDFMTSAYEGTTRMFGVPVWAVTIIGLIISTMLIFAFISAIFQRRL